jgi:hypothetical protein
VVLEVEDLVELVVQEELLEQLIQVEAEVVKVVRMVHQPAAATVVLV